MTIPEKPQNLSNNQFLSIPCAITRKTEELGEFTLYEIFI
jgi:hypothetical protein